jgi:alkanesulfonate monooxygenase SsuD/methylene tetrahydromethanopterin reductase-like flavin-dependent oxidoreductase (luciferase family)
VRFGIFDHVDDSGLPPAQHFAARLKLVEALDSLVFESYHVAEHHGTPLGLAPSPNVYLSAVAQRTRRLRFGPMVYVAQLYHPLRLAEEICMLDQMSGGRLLVGVGRGAAWQGRRGGFCFRYRTPYCRWGDGRRGAARCARRVPQVAFVDV